jgi:glc operon protein GlcG
MDNTQPASIEIALGKAVTANNVKRPTEALQDSVAPGSSTPRMQGLPGITPVDGGLPIVIDGKVVGAIGAGGAADLFISAHARSLRFMTLAVRAAISH